MFSLVVDLSCVTYISNIRIILLKIRFKTVYYVVVPNKVTGE